MTKDFRMAESFLEEWFCRSELHHGFSGGREN